MRTWCFSSLLLVAALALSGCHTRLQARTAYRASVTVPSEVVVTTPPPPVRRAVATRPAAPAADAVWVPGHYEWRGRWVWVPGHWERNRRGQVWVQPVAERRGGRVIYHPGYWRPADAAPPPVYRSPGPVRVAVRPSPGRSAVGRRPSGSATARQPRGGGSAVGRRPSGRATVRQPSGSATARQPSGGSATARGGGSATARRPSGGSASARRPSGGATARQPSGGGSASARRPSGGSATVRGGGSARRPSGGGSASARQPSRDVNRADDSVARARQRDDGDDREAPRVRPGVRTQPDRGDRTPSRRPRVRRDDDEGDARVIGDAPRIRRPGSQGPVPDRALTCSVDAARAPQGGLITVTGSFGPRARVQIGGVFAVIVNRGRGQLRVRLPGSAASGMVRVVEGGRRADCGRLVVIGR